MKKLNQLVLHKAKIMTAPQMKHITGGYGSDGGTCCVKDSYNGQDCANCGWSRAEAEKAVYVNGTHSNFCCDSCSSGTSGWGNIKCEDIAIGSYY